MPNRYELSGRRWTPRGAAYMRFLKNTGQMPNDKVKKPEVSAEDQKARMLLRRRTWELVFHKLN